jgi:hypothetical protein
LAEARKTPLNFLATPGYVAILRIKTMTVLMQSHQLSNIKNSHAQNRFHLHSRFLRCCPSSGSSHSYRNRCCPEQATALLSPNVRIFESGYVERSRDEYAGHHLGDDVAFAKSTSEAVRNQQELLKGDLAVVMRETETTGKFKGAAVHSFGTETAVLEKQGDSWVITHLHWSSRKAK